MKEFTAKEARNMADKSRVVSRKVRSILRSIKRAAKRGGYSLGISYSKWDDTTAGKICENLEGLGYRAWTDTWRAAIYVSWKGDE